MEEMKEDIVIVGAGIAGLTTSLGLHRLGIRSLVLEASESLRTTGFAISTRTNAWRALDALGVGDSLRQQHYQLLGVKTFSTILGAQTSGVNFKAKGKLGDHEVRCVVRKVLLEALSKELPSGAVRFSSKVVLIEESGFFKLVHLADGTVIRTKVLIGCDGVSSAVAKWLGFKKACHVGRSAIRGCAFFEDAHGFEPKILRFLGDGASSGFIPCDANSVYWFFTWTLSNKQESLGASPAEMKQFVLSKIGKVPDQVKDVVEKTTLDCILESQLRYRNPFELLWGNVTKSNVCVAGDALHDMTPDTGQGGCSALEDASFWRGVSARRCAKNRAELMMKKRSTRGLRWDSKSMPKRGSGEAFNLSPYLT